MTRLRWGASYAEGKRSPLLGFVPYHELDGRPNVVVDGSPTTGTVLCLSHWPGIASPAEFRADLSAQMAFAYLEAYDRHHPAADVVCVRACARDRYAMKIAEIGIDDADGAHAAESEPAPGFILCCAMYPASVKDDVVGRSRAGVLHCHQVNRAADSGQPGDF